jgi:hypothetical protein
MAAMNNIIKMADNPPHVPRTEKVHVRANQVMARWGGSHCYGRSDADTLADFDAILPEAKAALDDLHALARPASRQDIVNNLTVLLGCFSKGSVNGEVYGRTLAEYVDEMRPSICDIEHACRTMLKTRLSPFQPTIAEVLEALKGAKQNNESTISSITRLTTTDRSRLVQAAEQERQLAAEKERQRQQRLEYARKQIDESAF